MLGHALALAQRQWQTLVDVATDEFDQGIVGFAIEVPRLHPVQPEDPGGLHPMSAVDDQAVDPVDEHRWPVPRQSDQPLDVLVVEAALTKRGADAEVGQSHRDHLGGGGHRLHCLHHRLDQRSPAILRDGRHRPARLVPRTT